MTPLRGTRRPRRRARLGNRLRRAALPRPARFPDRAPFRRAARKLDPEVRIALRMGIYQLRYLERVPPHAAVAESVELVKRARKTLRRRLRQCRPAQGESRPRRVAQPRNRAVLPGVAAGPLGARSTAPRPPPAIARAALRRAREVRPHLAAGDRMQDIGSQSIVPLLALAARADAFSISAPRPATRPRRRSKPACAPSPAICTSTASPSSSR